MRGGPGTISEGPASRPQAPPTPEQGLQEEGLWGWAASCCFCCQVC